jgi:hypothetical protein
MERQMFLLPTHVCQPQMIPSYTLATLTKTGLHFSLGVNFN